MTTRSGPRAQSIEFVEIAFVVRFLDGRSLAVPLEWFPRLRDATPEQREQYEFSGRGYGIHWPELDEDAYLESLQAGETHDPEHDIEGMLAGTASPDLSLAELHLRQALVALAAGELEDTQHHVEHFQEQAGPEEGEQAREILDFLESGDLHEAEHEIQELLGGEEHTE